MRDFEGTDSPLFDHRPSAWPADDRKCQKWKHEPVQDECHAQRFKNLEGNQFSVAQCTVCPVNFGGKKRVLRSAESRMSKWSTPRMSKRCIWLEMADRNIHGSLPP